MTRRTFDMLTVFGLVLALVGLVALGSRGAPIWSLLREGRPDRGQIVARVATIAGWTVLLSASMALVVRHAVMRGRMGMVPLRTMMFRALPLTTVAVAVLSLLVIARMDVAERSDGEGGSIRARELSDRFGIPLEMSGWFNSAVTEGPARADLPEDLTAASERGFPYLLVVLIGIMSAVVAVAIWRWWNRRAALDEESERPAPPLNTDDAHGALVGTIDAMLADPDPRTSIRGAYARLLEGLAACATGRMAYEGPMEHLQRILSSLRARPAPVRELVALFELARFSEQPLTSDHRDRALRALRAVAADLRSPQSMEPAAALPSAVAYS